ncbi:MAG: organomercurial lyase MerB [Nocardioidaceae bacterium]
MTGTDPPMRVCLLHVPDCPLTEHVRVALQEAMRTTTIPVIVEEREGPYPSPTLLIDNRDVLTGGPPSRGACCRLELPTTGQIVAALEKERTPHPEQEGHAMTTPRTPDPVAEDTIALMRQYDGLDLLPVLLRLFAQGEPVTVTQLAAATERTPGEVEELFATLPTPDRDSSGRLLGLGLTLAPTPHRYTSGGHTLYTWCASDALFFPLILGEPARIESTCPATGQTVLVDATPDRLERVDPSSAVVSQLLPDQAVADIRTLGCAYGHFFTSADAATSWLAEHPTGHIATVADELDRCRHIATVLDWIPTPTPR